MPNQATDKFSDSIPNDFNDINITFYNALGQLIMEKKMGTSSPTISLQTLNPGVYFYKIESNSFSQSGKIIKQ